MMHTKLLLSICLVAVAVSLGVSYSVHAVRRTPFPVEPVEKEAVDPLAGLALAPAERRAIEEQFRVFHPKLLALQAQVDAKRAELAGALVESAGGPTIEACLGEISRLEAELDREVVKNLLLLKPHLSPEQQAKLFQYIEIRHSSTRESKVHE